MGLLRDLLAETVEEISGHRPDEETVAGFLRGIAVGGSAEPGLPARPATTLQTAGRAEESRVHGLAHWATGSQSRATVSRGAGV